MGEFPSTSDPSLAEQEEPIEEDDTSEQNGDVPHGESPAEIINRQGVRFLQSDLRKDGRVTPYGLPCVCRVTKYLASCIEYNSKRKLSDKSILIGLRLVTTVMECGSSLLETAPSVLQVVKDDLCKNLFAVSASCVTSMQNIICTCGVQYINTNAHTRTNTNTHRTLHTV